MSRFTTTGKNNTKFVYGYDRMLSYYFLDSVSRDGDFRHLVGLLSPVYGSAHNLLEMCDRKGVQLPPQHREELLLDLPLSEIEQEPPLSGPEYGDSDPDDSFIEDPPCEVDDLDSTLHHWEQT